MGLHVTTDTPESRWTGGVGSTSLQMCDSGKQEELERGGDAAALPVVSGHGYAGALVLYPEGRDQQANCEAKNKNWPGSEFVFQKNI